MAGAIIARRLATVLFVIMAILHLMIPVLNHYYFRTYAFDYGVYNYAFFDFAHLTITPDPVYPVPYPITFLQDHVSFTLLIISPLYWLFSPLFGTYSLLIIQWLFVLAGALFTYKLVANIMNEWMGLVAMALYFFLFGRYSSYQNDCNLLVMGAAILPVFLFCFFIERWWATVITGLFLLQNREDMALTMIFLAVFLLVHDWRNTTKRKAAITMIVASLAYFILVFTVIVPALETEEKKFSLFNYSALGEHPSDVIKFVFQHPVTTFQYLFINHHVNEPAHDGFKAGFYMLYAISGGWLLFTRPLCLLPFIPLIAKKMLNDDFIRWSYHGYQGVEVCSLLPAMGFIALAGFKRERLRNAFGTVAMLMALGASIYMFRDGYTWKYNFWEPGFYSADFDAKSWRKKFRQLPDDAAICASPRVLAHFANRRHIYYFPDIRDAEYIVLIKNNDSYPFSQEQFTEALEKCRRSQEWSTYDEDSQVLILRKVKSGLAQIR